MLLPNTVNVEGPDDGLESHLCPWNQTLPFVIRAVPQLELAHPKFLSPTVHFRLGPKHVEKELAEFARGLGVKPRVNAEAVRAGYAAQSTFTDALQEAGKEALARLRETGEPALVLVGRPYNIFDRSVNCDIPRKLRTLYGINVLPMEVLPLDEEDISDVNPNMYWNSGRRILAAARIVRRYPNLHLVYISNFKCGPDSYIKSFVDEAAGKPSLVLAVRRARERRGLHYALRSVSRQQRILAMSLFSHRHSSRKIGPDHPLSGKVVYIPTMGEGSPEAFAAAFRWLGVKAQPTPPSDERTRELGAKYTTGDECYPAKVTVGDFLRVIEQPGFDPEHTAFFMPTAEGPCRFGQYAPFLRKILRDAGWGNVQVLSPSSRNGYADLGDIANPFCARRGGRWCVRTPCTAPC